MYYSCSLQTTDGPGSCSTWTQRHHACITQLTWHFLVNSWNWVTWTFTASWFPPMCENICIFVSPCSWSHNKIFSILCSNSQKRRNSLRTDSCWGRSDSTSKLFLSISSSFSRRKLRESLVLSLRLRKLRSPGSSGRQRRSRREEPISEREEFLCELHVRPDEKKATNAFTHCTPFQFISITE